MGSKLMTLYEGTFKVEPVNKLKSGKYSYTVEVWETYQWKKKPGVWRILSTSATPGGIQITFQEVI